jgi:hypothetical protein
MPRLKYKLLKWLNDVMVRLPGPAQVHLRILIQARDSLLGLTRIMKILEV